MRKQRVRKVKRKIKTGAGPVNEKSLFFSFLNSCEVKGAAWADLTDKNSTRTKRKEEQA